VANPSFRASLKTLSPMMRIVRANSLGLIDPRRPDRPIKNGSCVYLAAETG